MAVLYIGHIQGGDGRVVAERTGEHITHSVIDTILHKCSADSVGGRAVNLAFHDGRIDHRAAVVDGNVVENPWNKSVTLDFDHRNMQLRRVRHGEIAVLLLLVWNLKG